MFSKQTFRKTVTVMIAITLIGSASITASAEDAYNPDLVSTPEGGATFLVGEDGANIHFSTLTASNK